MNQTSVFKSERGREAVRAFYNGILSMVPFTWKTVDTCLGKTFMLEGGDASKPPVFLLHGSCSNSAAWLGDIPALAAAYHVFAVDIPGEPGNSADRRPDLHSDAYPRWLCEIMDILRIEKAAVVGNSMGGWLALHFAAKHPQRTAAIALLAPSGLAEPKTAFMEQIAGAAETTDNMKTVGSAIVADTALPKEVLAFMALVAEHFIPITKALPVLGDAQLQSLSMPVLYVAGENDITMDTGLASRRLQTHVPHAEIHMLKGAHIITSAAAEILPFLMRQRSLG